MEYIASRGYDVYLLDIRGYGRSTRPLAMSRPASANPPFAGAEEGVRDITSAVDFIFKRRAIEKLNLLGWGGGTITAALYTTRNNARINKLVLYAPVWTPASVGAPPPPPTTAYRSVSSQAARQRWYAGVPADKQGALIPAGWYEAWERNFAKATRAHGRAACCTRLTARSSTSSVNGCLESGCTKPRNQSSDDVGKGRVGRRRSVVHGTRTVRKFEECPIQVLHRDWRRHPFGDG